MEEQIIVIPLTEATLSNAIQIVLNAGLDTKEEIEHHLNHINAHFVAMDQDKVVGVVGWYKDNVNYANQAMGDLFPGINAYWVGFFAVEKEYRNQGIGKRLLEKLESVVKEKGENTLWVSSVPETKTYYEKHGYILVTTGEINRNPKFFLKKSLLYKFVHINVVDIIFFVQ